MTLRTRQRLTSLAWGLSAVGAFALWQRNTPDRGSIPAIVDAPRHMLGPAIAGRVTAVFVRPGDRVRPGDALAQLATDTVDAELNVERGVYEELLAEADAVAAKAQAEVRERRRSLVTDLARARAALAAARGDEAANRAEIGSLREQLQRLDSVVRDGLTEADRVGELRARQAALTEAARHSPDVLQAWSGLASQVDTALAQITDETVAAQVRPVRARLETQAARITGLLEVRSRATLRAPVEGQVTQVFRASGDAVRAGEYVLQLVGTTGARVVAYAPEEIARRFVPGASVVARPRERGHEVAGVVKAVGSEVVELPAHLWLMPDRPRYGRPVYIEVKDATDASLLVGESMSVAMQANTGGAIAAVQTADAPPLLPVPESLHARTRFEGSGFIHLPEWDRFLAISDDTGPAGADKSPPWVFALDPVRGLDAEPVVVSGLETFSDLEAVTRGDDGSVYLLASQSLSQKGRRPQKRQLLVRALVEAQPRGLRVVESIPLYDALSAHLEPEQLEKVGFSALLDIEGMTFFEGGLLLGLKAPQDAAGQARLLRLRLGTGERRLEGLTLEPYRNVPLPTCRAQAPGGVSDLFLDGDTLYLTSTLPEGPPCGSAWRLSLASDGSLPVKLEDYEGYKPEGIARDAGGHLFVLFDAGDAPPRLTTLTPSKP